MSNVCKCTCSSVLNLFRFNPRQEIHKNIATVLSILSVLSDLSVVFCSRSNCQMCPYLTCLKSHNGRICDEVGGCTQASQRLSDLIWSPTCLCKEVGGFLTKCESIPLESKPRINELLSYICWYVGQLIMIEPLLGGWVVRRAHNLCHDNRQLIIIAINRNHSASKLIAINRD